MGDESYAAAIIPISARGEQSLVHNLTKVPIWAFHGEKDTTVDPISNYGSVSLVSAINAESPKVRAKVSMFLNVGHNAWDRTYKNVFSTNDVRYDPFKTNIYDWLLQYKKE